MSSDQVQRYPLGDAANRNNISTAQSVNLKYEKPDVMPVLANLPPAPPPVVPTRPVAPLTALLNGNQKPTPASSTAGKKRKAKTTLEEDIAVYKQNLDAVISPDSFEYESIPTCNAVRGRINKLIDSGIMNKTEFVKAIGCNVAALNRFLQASGPMGGSGSSIYYNAWAWFRQREVANLKMPDVKKRQKLEADAAAATTSAAAPKSTGKAAKGASSLPDISGIYLYGEEEDEVPVFDTCDEIRRKINQHLKTPGLTQAQFCRDLYAQLRVPKCKAIQSKQLADFRAMKGSRTGAKSSVFYAAYVYFEKLRIAQNKPKTAHRETMEELWEHEGGLSRTEDHRTMYITLAGKSLYVDQFGMMTSSYY